MRLFHSQLATNGNSNTFTVQQTGYFVLHLTGVFASEAFVLEMSPTGVNGTFVGYLPDGVAESFTVTDHTRSYIASGQTFRLNGDGGGGGTTLVDCYVSGDNIVVN